MTLRMAEYGRRHAYALGSLGSTPHTEDLEPEQDSNNDDVLIEEIPNPILNVSTRWRSAVQY